MRNLGRSRWLGVVSLGVVLSSGGAWAGDELDEMTESSIGKTINLMTDPTARKAALAKDPKGQAADTQAREIAGSEANTDEMYRLASDIFNTIARESGGDPQKMSQLMQAAAANPEAFAAGLNPAQQAKLKALANQVEATRGGKGH